MNAAITESFGRMIKQKKAEEQQSGAQDSAVDVACTEEFIDGLLEEKQKAVLIIKEWRKNAVVNGKQKAADDCNFLLTFLNKI